MTYRVVADAVVLVHFAFVVFVVVGGVLALRWPKVLWLHVPSVLYSVWIIVFSITCPLTLLERDLRERGGRDRYDESFIERYVEGVLYPGDMLRQAQAVAAVVVVASWVVLFARRQRPRYLGRLRERRPGDGPSPSTAAMRRTR
ncbi:MAG TPA: DUF2784 domain-containing protein [Acidimicrobiales bacterium]|nr:DUF2784 domain-containing protein [Acidimicrobiales bacterium]